MGRPRERRSQPLTEEARGLAERFFRLALRKAREAHERTGLPLDDLVSEACAELVKVAAWFDPSKGLPFAPIAGKWITLHLRRWCAKSVRRSRTVSFADLDKDGDRFDAAAPAERDQSWQAEVVAVIRRRLRPRDFECLWLHHVEGEPCLSISRRLHVNAHGRIVAARERLLECGVLRELGLGGGEEARR